MDAVDHFAGVADAFCGWVAHGTDTGEAAARTALLRVTRLYLAALELPPLSAGDADSPDANGVSDEEWRTVYAAAGRLPFDYYSTLFDPLPVPAVEPPVVGSLSDDLADIYRDVMSGLREYRAGRRAAAVWEWGFNLRTHWGGHAAAAMQALHAWLAANAPDRLATGG